jgi:hypothetical protein
MTSRDQRERLHLKKPPVRRDRQGVRENAASETGRRMNHNFT